MWRIDRYLKIRGMESKVEAFPHIPSFVSLKHALSGHNVTVLNVKSRCGELKLHKSGDGRLILKIGNGMRMILKTWICVLILNSLTFEIVINICLTINYLFVNYKEDMNYYVVVLVVMFCCCNNYGDIFGAELFV